MADEKNVIDVVALGKSIGMEEKEQTLPNGKVVKSLMWDQENLVKAVEAVKGLSAEGKPVSITGPAPAWLVSALAHAVHPCQASTYVPQIGKDVPILTLAHGERNPEGGLTFTVKEQGDAVLVEYTMDEAVYDEENLSKVAVPPIPNGKHVYLSGRGPNYITASVAEAYAHTDKSVSLFQPGTGYTCSITHSKEKKLGDLDKDPLGKEELKQEIQKDATKEVEAPEKPGVDRE